MIMEAGAAVATGTIEDLEIMSAIVTADSREGRASARARADSGRQNSPRS